MSTVRTAAAKASWGWTAARLLVELAAFAGLLFLTRFVARGHLISQMDQECYIGGIGVDVLAHGVRFPLLTYAPNEYDNGSFLSGVFAAISFALLGRSVLALKLVTHFFSAAGAVATLWLLRGCLQELGLTSRLVRWAAGATLVIALALAPRIVTLCSMYAVGNHAEGSAIDTLLLALFARRLHARSAARTMAFWALVGLALYINKGTVLVIPVLGAVEIALAWRSRRRLLAALGGFALGVLPELLVIAQREGMGWATMVSKAERNSRAFPQSFIDALLFLGEYRIELLAAWALALCVGITLLFRSVRRCRQADPAAAPPVNLGLAVGVTCLHLAALTVMAKGGLDAYEIYGYPTLVVLVSVMVASGCAHAVTRWGQGAGAVAGAGAIALTLAAYRPDAFTWNFGRVAALWRDQAGAACSWRFGEGFEREQEYGLAPPGRSREQHAIARCRLLSEPVQVLDCIGGIARELNWRQGGKVDGAPPAELDADERRAYAYYYGTHRAGKSAPCREFESPDLSADCVAAVQLECLLFADLYTRVIFGRDLGRPQCAVPEPPLDGIWAALRAELLTRAAGSGPNLTGDLMDKDFAACQPVFEACY